MEFPIVSKENCVDTLQRVERAYAIAKPPSDISEAHEALKLHWAQVKQLIDEQSAKIKEQHGFNQSTYITFTVRRRRT